MGVLRGLAGTILVAATLFLMFMAGTGFWAFTDADPDFHPDEPAAVFTLWSFLALTYLILWWSVRTLARMPREGPRGWGWGWALAWWRPHVALHTFVLVALLLYLLSFRNAGSWSLELSAFVVSAALAAWLGTMVHRLRTGSISPVQELHRASKEVKEGLEGQVALEDTTDLEWRVRSLKVMQWTLLGIVLVGFKVAKEVLKGTRSVPLALVLIPVPIVVVGLYFLIRVRLARASRDLLAKNMQELHSMAEEAEYQAARERPRP